MDRALESNPHAHEVALFDFGYGTGRVTNELVSDYVRKYGSWHKDLRVVAYDVSSMGLMKSKDALCSAGFEATGQIAWDPRSTEGYIAGSVRKKEGDLNITVIFVHGYEGDPPSVMYQLALKANDGHPYLLTTSWYSGLGHIPGQELRQEYFHYLGELTDPQGEIVMAMSSTGDLVTQQDEWVEKLVSGNTQGYPIEAPGDVVYDTELGQANFYHVFGTDLSNHMDAITESGQYWWVEGIRCPDEEFESEAAEQANYKRVCEANEEKRGQSWTPDDYREFHTVAAFRSPQNPGQV
jgi:hypothetical protein